MMYLTKVEKEAYEAGCRSVEKEKQSLIETLMQSCEELQAQVDGLERQKGKLLARDFQPYSAGFKASQKRADEHIADINKYHNAERDRWQREMDKLRAELATAKAQIGDMVSHDTEAHKVWKAGIFQPDWITRPDLVHDGIDMTGDEMESGDHYNNGYDDGYRRGVIEGIINGRQTREKEIIAGIPQIGY